jgi:hypothetical protein
MAYMSARELLSGLPVKMAHGGPVHTPSGEPLYGKGATAADLLAAEQRVLGEIAADPSGWDVETAYNAILESGVTIDDALAAGVKQTTIDAIFRSGAPLPETFSTPSTVTSGFAAAPYAGQDLQPFYTQAQDYVTRLMDDGVIDEAERREAQTLATRGGFTFQDFAAAGVDPSILFTQHSKTCCSSSKTGSSNTSGSNSGTPFPQTQEEYVTPTVYQPLPDNTSVYAAGEESLDREFRDSAPRTEVLDSYGNLTNFDYTPAASLRSATGSGYNWTPPTVTGRPRSLMGADLLARYTGGRSAADLRQLTTGLGNGRTYSDYTGVLQNPGSYGGGLSKSQLYSRMRGLDYQLDKAAAADRQASGASGGISAYLAANPDIAASYESQRGQLGGQSLEQFARNHYNTTGRAEMAAGTRGLFTLVADTPVSMSTQEDAFSGGFGGYEGEGDNYGATNWNQRYDMGKAGGVTRPFAHGGSVKKPQGFADGGTASADLEELNKYAGGGIIDKAIQKGAEALGFDDERQVAISQEAVDITNQMVDAGLIGEQYRVELIVPTEASQRTRQNTGIKGDEEVFNAVNHALFAYDAGQSTLGALGAQAKEVYQGLSRKAGGNDPRSEYLDYFNNKFGFNLAEQGLSREEAKNAIMNNLGNLDNQGTRGRMARGEELKAGVDLLTNIQDAKYPWE